MEKANLTIDHLSAQFPSIEIETLKAIPEGKTFHLCSFSFRFFLFTELESIEVKNCSSDSKSKSIKVVTENGEIKRHRMKLSLGELVALQDIPKGSKLKIQLNPIKGKINVTGDVAWDLRVAQIDEEEFQANVCRFPLHEITEPFWIYCKPSIPHRLEAYRRFNGELIARIADADGATTSISNTQLKAESINFEETLTLSSTGAGKLDVGKHIHSNIKLTASEFTVLTNPLPKIDDDHSVFFGDIHWHTAFSTDGQRALEKALTSARDELGLDFCAPSDHALDEGDYGRATVQDQAKICQRFTENNSFVVLPGFELSRRYGHCNIYPDTWEKLYDLAAKFKSTFSKVLKSNKDRFCVEELISLFDDDSTLVIPHHTNMGTEGNAVREDGRSAWTAFAWPNKFFPNHLKLIEINQQRGAFESEIPDPYWQPDFWKKFQGGLGGSAQTALTKGHRIGFLGGTDNHNGWPSLEGNFGKVGGVTGVIAKELSVKSIHQALTQRRCYATTGARIVADAKLNGLPIGTELKIEPSTKRHFTLSLKGTAPFERIELISFGQVIHQFNPQPDSTEFESEWIDDRPERPLEHVYYYIRAKQKDGHCIWLSPWWVDLP